MIAKTKMENEPKKQHKIELDTAPFTAEEYARKQLYSYLYLVQKLFSTDIEAMTEEEVYAAFFFTQMTIKLQESVFEDDL